MKQGAGMNEENAMTNTCGQDATEAGSETLDEYLVQRPVLMLTFLDVAERYASEVQR